MALGNVVDNRVELDFHVAVHDVGVVNTLVGLVGRDRNNTQFVRGVEFCRFSFRSTGHSGQFVVHAEVILQCDGGQSLVLGLNLHAFLSLNCLVQTFVVPATFKNTSRVFVNDEYFTVKNHVVLVACEQFLCANRVVEEADELGVGFVVQVANTQVVFHPLDTGFHDTHGAFLFVDFVVAVALQTLHYGREVAVPPVSITFGRARNDQWCTRFVNQNRVDLIDDRESMATLHLVVCSPRHVVAQVVETEFVVGAVCNVGGVLLTTYVGGLLREDAPRFHSQETEDATHQFRLVAGQIVVHGHYVNTAPGQGVEICWRGCNQCLTFTGLHFSNVAQVQSGTTHELHVVVLEPHRTGARFTDSRERLGKN